MRDLEKQLNYMDSGTGETSEDTDDIIQRANKNLYGYGDDYYEILKRDQENGLQPNVRKIVRYHQVQINDMCKDLK